jgi:hypothetical protein
MQSDVQNTQCVQVHVRMQEGTGQYVGMHAGVCVLKEDIEKTVILKKSDRGKHRYKNFQDVEVGKEAEKKAKKQRQHC